MKFNPIKPLNFITQLLLILLVLIQIALMPWFEVHVPFEKQFIISLCVGVLILVCVFAISLFLDFTKLIQVYLSLGASVIAGSLAGGFLGVDLSGIGTLFPEEMHEAILLKIIAWSIYLGMAICLFFVFHQKISLANEVIWKEKLKNLENNKQLVEAQLKILQAQIEPHFLFNSLANILSLIDIDKNLSKKMLENFINYLRMTLDKSREEYFFLKDEVDMITAYLDIFKIRMGNRLKVNICISEEALLLAFPSMLLQPLVENAIKHGLEPTEAGGEIKIYDEVRENNICIIVEDTGVGLNNGGNSKSFGLKNVCKRLDTLYGNKGVLNIESNQPHGVRATVTIPYEYNK